MKKETLKSALALLALASAGFYFLTRKNSLPPTLSLDPPLKKDSLAQPRTPPAKDGGSNGEVSPPLEKSQEARLSSPLQQAPPRPPPPPKPEPISDQEKAEYSKTAVAQAATRNEALIRQEIERVKKSVNTEKDAANLMSQLETCIANSKGMANKAKIPDEMKAAGAPQVDIGVEMQVSCLRVSRALVDKYPQFRARLEQNIVKQVSSEALRKASP